MEPLITPAESGRLDTVADDPPEMLMERAGVGVALMAVEMGIGYGDRVTVLAGRGNNGGDGYVAAKYLARRGVDVTIRSFGYPRGDTSPARKAALACPQCGADMRIIAFVTDGVSVRGILEHIGEPAQPPPVAPARPCATPSVLRNPCCA